MPVLEALEPQRVFHYFEEICAIPHGSQNMEAIADYCMAFADSHALKATRDDADNVIIFKPASAGYEQSAPLILQGHLDMVCQKTEDCGIDFSTDGLELFIDGDQIGAKGTTLGADNGIAAAMILSILESDDIPHPPIEAVFTTDEEIGMIGAGKLDKNLLKGRRMINLDAEEDDTLTVSCAGGSDFRITMPLCRETAYGTAVTVTFKGLKGGHSGVEIHTGRVNADMLAGRFLNHMAQHITFELIGINGGDKSNAIPNTCVMQLCTAAPEAFVCEAEQYLDIIKAEITAREPDFSYTVTADIAAEHRVMASDTAIPLIRTLTCAPNGVMDMSAEIDGLVETSLNLGVLKTADDYILLHFALRSNKQSALIALEEKMTAFCAALPCEIETFGHYPPWEFKADSALQQMYKDCFTEQYGKAPKVEAIHAGLECGLFSAKLEGLDCIAIGPSLADVHTVNERLSIASTAQTYKLLLRILEKCR